MSRLFAFGLALAIPALSQASPWFAPQLGQTAIFERADGSSRTTAVTTTETLFNGVVALRREVEETLPASPQEYWNYWTVEPDGTYLHGFWRPQDGFGKVYEPPILFVPNDPAAMGTWTSTFLVHDFETGFAEATVSYTYEDGGAEEIEVPAGTFATRRILDGTYVLSRAAGLDTYEVTGRRRPLARRVELEKSTSWMAVGVGFVRDGVRGDEEDELYELIAGTVDVPPGTWGAVKGLYRE